MGTGVSSTSRREASMATYGVVSARGATKRRMRARSETSLSSLVEATGASTVEGSPAYANMQMPHATRTKAKAKATTAPTEANPSKKNNLRMTLHTSLANMLTLKAEAPHAESTSMANV